MAGVIKYGCHCDLDPDMEPDDCVLDYGGEADCVLARKLLQAGLDNLSCKEWRPIKPLRDRADNDQQKVMRANVDLEMVP